MLLLIVYAEQHKVRSPQTPHYAAPSARTACHFHRTAEGEGLGALRLPRLFGSIFGVRAAVRFAVAFALNRFRRLQRLRTSPPTIGLLRSKHLRFPRVGTGARLGPPQEPLSAGLL